MEARRRREKKGGVCEGRIERKREKEGKKGEKVNIDTRN